MATTIAILKDGTPVRIHLFDNPIFDVDGFLVRFTTLETNPQVYRYHQHAEFKREDRKKPDLSGYYNEDLFLKYIQKVEPIPTLDILTKYNFNKILATEEEEITVSTIDFDKPYDYFYNEKKYTFNLQRTLDNKGVRNYLKPIIENFKTVDIKINTDGVNGVTIVNNQSGTPGGYFYKKNLGDFINTRTISDIQKSNYKKIMSLIVFKIREINKYIIPIIAANTHFFDKEFDVANGIIDYNDTTTGNRLTDLEKLLFDLKRGWGYYYNPLNPEDFPLREDFDAQFTQLSSYQDYLAYHSSLENFYNKCYITKNLEHYPSDKKLQYLLEILSSSALSLLPYEFRINTIKKYLKINLSEEDQRLMVRLVLSINPSRANDFLDFLLEKEDGVKTNFQVIYDSLTDARLERYPYVNWFINEQTNRKYFAFAIFELWKVSKYDLNYIRPGIVVPETFPNFRGVDPQNYFYVNKDEYIEKNWLTFIPSSTESITTTAQYFESSLVGKKININKISKTDINIEHGGYHDTDVNVFGSFHLYQQISFSGFKANLDLAIPTMATVPAFLFHFIQEYDELADFDAGIALAVNLTVDALLIYFTGGMSVLRDLQYLKYSTKIGRALQGGISGVEGVEVWRGLEVGSEIFTATTLGLININHYLITTENDDKKKEILEKCQTVFLILMMMGAASSITARSKAVREAGEALRLIDALPPNTLHNIPQAMIDVLTTLSGQKAVTLTLFGNKLNNLELGGALNTIAAKYNMIFTDAQRLAFWKDFQHIDDPAFWRLLNSAQDTNGVLNGKYVDNWLSLTEIALPEAKFTDYICVQKRTDALLNFDNKPALKSAISTLNFERKLKFIDDFKNIDNSIIELLNEYSQSVQVWVGHTFEGKTLIGQNAEIWLKHFKAREYLKNRQYEEVAQLFGKEIKIKTLVQDIRYITDGAYDIDDLKKAIEIADRSDDIVKISTRLKIPNEIISKVKNHYYIEEQFILYGDDFFIGRFERISEDNNEWLRMADEPLVNLSNDEILAFKRLVAHEYIELKLMEKGLSYRSLNTYNEINPFGFGAHDIAPLIFDSKYTDVKRLLSPPSLNINNFENLDQIINWYINFYKL